MTSALIRLARARPCEVEDVCAAQHGDEAESRGSS